MWFCLLISIHKLESRCFISWWNIFASWETKISDFYFFKPALTLTGKTLKNWCRPAEIGHTCRYFINYFGIGTCMVVFYGPVGPSNRRHLVEGKRPAWIELKNKIQFVGFYVCFISIRLHKIHVAFQQILLQWFLSLYWKLSNKFGNSNSFLDERWVPMSQCKFLSFHIPVA